MKIYLSVLLCLLAIACTAKLDTAAPSFYERAWDNLSSYFLSREAQVLRRVTRCAQLPLSKKEQKHFQSAYSTLANKQEWLELIDPQHVLPQDYRPQDLVTVRQKGWPKKATLRREAMQQMEAMIAAALQDGVELIPISTYRTWEYQNGLYQRNLARNGGKPSGYVARAGESQHHLGTAVDFNTVSPKDENIPALVWLRQHAGEYGFSLSFPKGAEAEQESGYPYEAWHYRYITKEGVNFQNTFFDGNQHRTLAFFERCQPAKMAEKETLP